MNETPTRGRGKRGPRRPVPPLFISKAEIAKLMGLGNPATIDRWIAEGGFPPPHSRPGERYAVWLRAHWDAYVARRAWPKEAWPGRNA